jgi:hypothetical protein
MGGGGGYVLYIALWNGRVCTHCDHYLNLHYQRQYDSTKNGSMNRRLMY